ncbi:sigma factor-like helix-turn-helix DNA-binding protein [Paenarthrobacter sp. NPDC089989]|uniref:sigma factor-like helix-turn-helix DNA-binding protein n=1 Tax=unclassified Paenarthrobacter TaxID=2634190 RepID=UPI0038068840
MPTDTFDVPHLEPYPDALLSEVGPAARAIALESIDPAFVSALQHLPPRQPAALVLCDVLGFPISEAADMLDGGQRAASACTGRDTNA